MTPLPRWAPGLFGALLVAGEQAEVAQIDALPADHTHVEVGDDQSQTQMETLGASASGPVTPTPTGWLGTGSNYDTAMRAKPSWSPAYDQRPDNTAVIWYAADQEKLRAIAGAIRQPSASKL